ncbi:MAG: hypothetical protein AB1696_24165 [Planctomycetota bacterium]
MRLIGITATLGLAAVIAATRADDGQPQPRLRVKTRPGCYYDLLLPEGGPPAADPLSPMSRKRFIIKCDDLAMWSLEAFKRFARMIEEHNAKAGLGIIPGQCTGDEVFDWIRTLDPDRFEIWNHTWTHGKGGPNHYQRPYDVQWRNLVQAHEKVREKAGIVMHTWGGGGIQYQGRGVHDQDEVTHWVVRNHPDYKVHFHAFERFADRGFGSINSHGVFMPWRYSWFEKEEFNAGFVEKLKERWPDIAWNRPPALGDAAELKWRFDHPFWYVPESGKIDSMVAQFHPASWDDEKLKALGELLEYVKSKGDWCFANAYETCAWLMGKPDITVTKIKPLEYRLDVKSTRFEHTLDLDLPADAEVREHIYSVNAFKPK